MSFAPSIGLIAWIPSLQFTRKPSFCQDLAENVIMISIIDSAELSLFNVWSSPHSIVETKSSAFSFPMFHLGFSGY